MTTDRPGRVSEAARDIGQRRAGRVAVDTEAPGGSEVVSELLEAAGEGGEGRPEPGMERMREAARGAAMQAEETGGLGRLGRPMDRRSPFFIGMAGAAGVVVTIALVELIIRARSVLVLIGLALFIAAGLDPVVSWLTRHRMPRWAAVVTVLLGVLAVIGGFLAAAIPPMAAQTTNLIAQLPHYAHTLQDHNSQLGRLNVKYHIEQRLSHLLATRGSSLVGGVLGAGALVLGALAFDPGGARPGGVLPGRDAADQAVRLPAGAALPPGPGDPDRGRDLHQGRRVRPWQRGHLGDRRAGHLPVDAGVRHPLSDPAGAVRGHHGPDPGDRLHDRWCRGVPGGADRFPAGRDRHARLLHRLPARRGLPARPADHGQHGEGARRGVCWWRSWSAGR